MRTRYAVGLALLAAALLLIPAIVRRKNQPVSVPGIAAATAVPARAPTPFERTLQRAWKLRSRALMDEIHHREALESWDPPGTAALDEEPLRREYLAQDASGDLHRARARKPERSHGHPRRPGGQ
jgi:hypothetical protein